MTIKKPVTTVTRVPIGRQYYTSLGAMSKEWKKTNQQYTIILRGKL